MCAQQHVEFFKLHNASVIFVNTYNMTLCAKGLSRSRSLKKYSKMPFYLSA